jgi:hypothetical protein
MGAQKGRLIPLKRDPQGSLFLFQHPGPEDVEIRPSLEFILEEEEVTWEEVSIANKCISRELFDDLWEHPARSVHRMACLAIAIAVNQKKGEGVDAICERLFRKRSGRGGIA